MTGTGPAWGRRRGRAGPLVGAPDQDDGRDGAVVAAGTPHPDLGTDGDGRRPGTVPPPAAGRDGDGAGGGRGLPRDGHAVLRRQVSSPGDAAVTIRLHHELHDAALAGVDGERPVQHVAVGPPAELPAARAAERRCLRGRGRPVVAVALRRGDRGAANAAPAGTARAPTVTPTTARVARARRREWVGSVSRVGSRDTWNLRARTATARPRCVHYCAFINGRVPFFIRWEHSPLPSHAAAACRRPAQRATIAW